jgi:hypothetical protein
VGRWKEIHTSWEVKLRAGDGIGGHLLLNSAPKIR